MSLHSINNLIISILLLPFMASAQVEPPEPPIMERVSVLNDDGDVIISWQPSTTAGVEGYIIYEYIGDLQGVNTIQLDVVDQFQTSYQVTSTETNSQSVAYVVAAFIMDGDTIRSALTTPQRTIFLEVGWDPCITRNELTWNSYIGWDTHLESYQILYYPSGSGIVTDLGSTNPPDTIFSHSDPPFNESICYMITAINDQGFESTSNRFCIHTSVLVPPSYVYASFASVNSDNNVEIHFHPDPLAQTNMYEIHRSGLSDGPYEFLENISHYPPSGIIFTDLKSNLKEVQFYKMIALNQCNIPVVESNLASNISLKLTQMEGSNILHWNPYETWFGGIQEYEIYRKTGNDFPVLLGSVLDPLSGFMDDPTNVAQVGLTGEFCYFIKAIEGDSNPLGFKSTSISNTNCAFSEPQILIPNAFTPDDDGVNDYFAIFSTFVPKTYHLIIYDRWRNIVFESKEYIKHWDGLNRKGRKSPEGIYTYVLSIVTQSGQKIQKSGQIALLYP